MIEANEVQTEEKKVTIDRSKYEETRAASGAKSLSNGDEVALVLGGLPVEAVHAIGSELLDIDTAEKYGHLNAGMQRMNVGNRLRGWVNKAPEGEDRLETLRAVAEPHIVAAQEAEEPAAEE